MSIDVTSQTPIAHAWDLVAWLEAGCKPSDALKIGTEHEKFVFYTSTHRPVSYEDIRALLLGIQRFCGWQDILEGDRLIGLADSHGGGAISLEPGGQFELSGGQLDHVIQTETELQQHLSWCLQVGAELGIGFLGLGTSPLWPLDAIPRMPKGRYRIMTDYMPKVGSQGLNMMYRTCTIQANLDFTSEADMVRKLRVSLALQPIATALFASSPFLDGTPNGFVSYRSEIWRHTDPARSGMLPFAFEDGMGFERYVDYALDVPMYFVKRGSVYHDVAGASFRDLLAGRLEGFSVDSLTIADWANHLSTLFPEVRLKRYLEMRGSDGGSSDFILAAPALWAGLLYDGSSLDAAWDLVKHWEEHDRQELRDMVPRLGLQADVCGRSVLDIARDMLALSRSGLARRAQGEERFLAPLERVVTEGRTHSEWLLEHYRGRVEDVFQEQCFSL